MSALVTLFANILQNPNDARARSDVKLMNVVVNFLSTLVSDESNGSIKRMLGLCGEFERIAKVVLDKAEKESHARKKRKCAPGDSNPTQTNINQNQPNLASSTKPAQAPPTSGPFSPSMFTAPDAASSSSNGARHFGIDPTMPSNTGIANDLPSDIDGMPGLGQEFSDWLGSDNVPAAGFSDQPSFPTSPDMPSFQQPFVPQDLWQMPMTIEWDWADMSTNFPVFEAGNNQPPQ